LLTKTADLARQTASIGSSSVAGHAPRSFLARGVPLPAALRTARPGRMNAADCSAASPHPAALLGFKRFYPSQVSSPRRTTMAFPQRRPRVSFDQPVPAPTVFVGRPIHPAAASFVRRPASPNRGCDCSRLGGSISRRRSDRSDSSRSIDPALGFVLLQGCGRAGHAAWAPRQPFRRATSVVSSPRVIRQSPARSSRAHPLLGLRRPSCADVTGISSGCIHLHGAVSAWLRRRRPFSVL
jgi:hypothetical protein